MEEKSLKILAIQMSSIIGDKEANFKKAEKLIEENIKPQTDIIVLPEVWTVGWKCSEFGNLAEDLENSETIEFLSNIAKKHDVNIIGGSFIKKRETGDEKRENHPSPVTRHPLLFNTCPVINRQGELVATYDKMHLFSYYGCLEGSYVENGVNPVMIEFDWETGNLCAREQGTGNREQSSETPSRITLHSSPLKIGLTICYDIRFPEIYRAYAKGGADVLINMAAWPKSRAIHWESLTKARAIENQCFMVALTQSGLIEGEEWNLGHSRIIDYSGETVAEIDNGEGAMYAEVKFEDMYEFRKKCTVLKDIHKNYEIKEGQQ